MDEPIQLRVQVLLALQAVLLGAITPPMQSVLVSWTEGDIRVRVVFDGKHSAEDAEQVSVLETELMAHFPDYGVACFAVSLGVAPDGAVPVAGEVFVFRRAGELQPTALPRVSSA